MKFCNSRSAILTALILKHQILTFVLISLFLPGARLGFTIKCVPPPARYFVYMGKIVQSVFPTLAITFLLILIFLLSL